MFKNVKGWEGLYTVNEKGVIKSTARNGNGFKEHIMTQSTDSYGYKVVKMRNKNKVCTLKVHRIVATAFLPNPDNKPQVNHKDGNKTNNNVTNLEWVTASENIKHAKILGLQQECPNRIKVCKVSLTGEYLATYKSLKEAGAMNNICWTGISAVLRGKRKTAGGFKWVYCN